MAIKKKKPKRQEVEQDLPQVDFDEINDSFEDDYEEIDEIDEYEDYEDDYEDYEEENEELEKELEKKKKRKSNIKVKKKENKVKYHDPLENDIEQDEDKFIDKKNKKIIPTGGNNSKKVKIKAKEVDDRKNALVSAKVITTLIMFIIVCLFGLGIINTFFPRNNFTREEIEFIARSSVNDIGFPIERGQSFAEAFITQYLTIDYRNPQQNVLTSYFYTGDMRQGATSLNRTMTTNIIQEVIISPQLFESIIFTRYSAQFHLSTFVTNLDGELPSREAGMTGRWVSFAVNVYYCHNTDRMAITPDSPILLPTQPILAAQSLPPQRPFGNGNINNDMLPILTPTIDGFVQAFANSSLASHNQVLPFIPANPNVDLISGFGGTVRIRDTPSNSIRKVVYNTNIPGEYRVDVTVDWVEVNANANAQQISHRSRYVMRIITVGEGQFLVTRFAPYLFETR